MFTKEFELKPYYEMYIYFIRLKNVPKFPRNVTTMFSTHCHNFLKLFFLLKKLNFGTPRQIICYPLQALFCLTVLLVNFAFISGGSCFDLLDFAS